MDPFLALLFLMSVGVLFSCGTWGIISTLRSIWIEYGWPYVAGITSGTILAILVYNYVMTYR